MTPRITILNRLFWPRRFGGLEHLLWHYANTLVDAGTAVHVITESVDGSPDYEQVRDNLTVQRHPAVNVGRLWRVGELVQVRWWQNLLAQAPPSDIIWSNNPTSAVAAIRMGLASKLLYWPVFCYEGLNHVAHQIPEMAPLKRSLLARRMDRYAYKRAAVIIDESHNLRQQQQYYYGTRPNTLVIPNPVHMPESTACQRASFGLSDEHFVIGFVGRPGDPCKDLPFLINAIKSQAMPRKTRLLLVGGGANLEQAKQWVKDAGLSPQTIWTGDLKDPSPAFAAMDAFVLPSRFETFGNVLIEAQAHGLPTLGRAADYTGKPPIFTASAEIIDNGITGYVVDPYDPAELGAKLLSLANNPALAREMGAIARQRAASYTWADAGERYLQAMGLPTSQTLTMRQAA